MILYKKIEDPVTYLITLYMLMSGFSGCITPNDSDHLFKLIWQSMFNNPHESLDDRL